MEASDDGDGSGSAPSTAASVAAFTITTELALSSDIPIACWCPTMDLCAVVSADGQLHLHRMDWQLLWAVSPEALVTAVTWRPDGKEIAAGHANGAISILDVETGGHVSSSACRRQSSLVHFWVDLVQLLVEILQGVHTCDWVTLGPQLHTCRSPLPCL
eukprot:GHRQ01030401.1.p1 GENE.GHRQ01030401.1~~GHRQ01030401.1.p1  ORF type:complete len:159 (-),score=28.72 GHRQ01030401.1:246-722(-)